MSKVLLDQLAEIQQKIKRLKQLLESEQSKIQNLEIKLAKLESELDTQKNANKELEETNKISKLANAITLSHTDVKEHKRLINQYIREIDTCIRLLSD
jgi:septation ring formation regulator EzrA